MRLWLGTCFAAVGLITAAAVYLLVRDSSGHTLRQSSTALALGRTVRLADRVNDAFPGNLGAQVQNAQSSSFSVWVVGHRGKLLTPAITSSGQRYSALPRLHPALTHAMRGARYDADLPGNVTVIAEPILGPRNRVKGAVVTR